MVAHLEKGDCSLSYEKLAILIERFHLSPRDLFYGNENESKGYVQRIRPYLGSQKIILNAAGGVVVKDNKVLLQRRSDNHEWGLLGGLLEMNETDEEAAIREVKEESGLIVRPISFLGIFHNHEMVWANGDQAHTIGAYFLFEIVGGELRLDEESLELKYFGKDEAPYLFASDHREALKAYWDGVGLPLLNENHKSQSK